MYNASPICGERFYLRMLLNVVRGPRNYEQIWTVDGIVYPDFKQACHARGMRGGDEEWLTALNDASKTSLGPQMRVLFVIILKHCNVGDNIGLWEKTWNLLSEDIIRRHAKNSFHHGLQVTNDEIKNFTLLELQNILNDCGGCLKDYGLPEPVQEVVQDFHNSLILEELNVDIEAITSEHKVLVDNLNEDQMAAYDAIIQSVEKQSGGFFCVYGHGGTGKTHLWKALISRIRSMGSIVLPCASSGIAATLLSRGRATYSRFMIPVLVHEGDACNISLQSALAQLIQKADLIIWDEASLDHKFAFEAVNVSLKEIMFAVDKDAKQKIFGGKTVVLGGDFRQILPVVVGGDRHDVVNESINKSFLWDSCRILRLTKNMRLISSGLTEQRKNEMNLFSEWILGIGDGVVPAKTN